MRRTLKITLVVTVLLFCVSCDQATKSVAKKLLASSDPTSLLSDLIIFEYAENPGGFMSIGAELPGGLRILIFAVLAGAVLAMILVLAIRDRDIKVTQLIGLAMATGGGMGNLTDRVLNDGRVVDFVSVGMGSVRTGIFNVADLAITAGVVVLVAGLMRERARSREAT